MMIQNRNLLSLLKILSYSYISGSLASVTIAGAILDAANLSLTPGIAQLNSSAVVHLTLGL